MFKNKKGSILIPVLIIFLIIAGIAVALMQRSLEGAKIVTESKKAFSSYQRADESTEEFLNELKKLDGGDSINGGIGDGNIPENTDAFEFCNAGGWTCYYGGCDPLSEKITSGDEKKVSDIHCIQESGTELTSKRTISVPIQGRIANPIKNGKIEITRCSSGNSHCDHPNECELYLSWENNDTSDISGFEIRRSSSGSLSSDNWWKIDNQSAGDGEQEPNANELFVDSTADHALIKNGDSQSDDQYNKIFYYSIKAKNKNNFMLDSLFVSLSAVTIKPKMDNDKCPEINGGGTEISLAGAQGCINSVTASSIPGIEVFGMSDPTYNCCNGTECYKAKVNWRESSNEECAIETCEASDDVELNSNGTPSTGYCGTKQDCFTSASLLTASFASPSDSIAKNPSTAHDTNSYPADVTAGGDDCDRPYKTLGYCTEVPGPSSQYPAFLGNSSWVLSNFKNVYENSSDTDNTTMKPRCAMHTCPNAPTNPICDSGSNNPGSGDNVQGWTISPFTCTNPTPTTCGPYTASFTCTPICADGWEIDKADSRSSGGVTVTYAGTCCTESDTKTPKPKCSDAPINKACGTYGHWNENSCSTVTADYTSSECWDTYYDKGTCSCSGSKPCGTAIKTNSCSGGSCNKSGCYSKHCVSNSCCTKNAAGNCVANSCCTTSC